MFIEFPWLLSALTALPVLTIIYFLRNRSKPKTVSALFLWASPNQAATQGQKIQKLNSNWLMFLELLILTLLILTAANIQILWKPWNRSTILVLDDSWSMQASKNQAIVKINNLIDRKLIGFPVQIIKAGKKPVSWGQPCVYPSELSDKLSRWTPLADQSDLSAAINHAKNIAGIPSDNSATNSSFRSTTGSAARVVVITDTPAEKLADAGNVAIIAVGKPESNLAFCNAIRYNTSDKNDVILADIANLSSQQAQVNYRIQLSDENKIQQQTQTATIPAGKTVGVKIPVPVNSVVELGLPDDVLQLDNRAVIPPLQSVTVRVKLDIANGFLERFVHRAIELSATEERKISFTSSFPCDLWITDSSQSETISTANSSWTVQFIPSFHPTGTPKPVIYKGPYIVDSKQPLLLGTNWEGILWGTEEGEQDNSSSSSIPATEDTLIAVGNIPLATYQRFNSGSRLIRFAIKPEISNLLKSPNFPILICNLVHLTATSLPGLRNNTVPLGSPLILSVSPSDGKSVLVNNLRSQREIPVRFGQAVFTPQTPGLYTFKTQQNQFLGAANAFDIRESNLQNCDQGEWGTQISAFELQRQYFSLRIPLLLLVLILACVHQWLVKRETNEQ